MNAKRILTVTLLPAGARIDALDPVTRLPSCPGSAPMLPRQPEPRLNSPGPSLAGMGG